MIIMSACFCQHDNYVSMFPSTNISLVHVCMYVLYVCMCVYVHSPSLSFPAYMHTYMYAHTHTHQHVHVNTCTQNPTLSTVIRTSRLIIVAQEYLQGDANCDITLTGPSIHRCMGGSCPFSITNYPCIHIACVHN